MDLGALLNVLKRRWIAFLVILLVPIAIAGIVSGATRPVYVATASGQVVPFAVTNGRAATTAECTVFANAYAATAFSRAVSRQVIADLKLTDDEAALRQRLTVTRPPSSNLIQIAAQDSDPAMAAQIANTYVAVMKTQIAAAQNANQPGVQLTEAASAVAPTQAAAPRTDLNIALGTLIGALGGFGVLSLRVLPQPGKRIGATASRLR